MAKQLWIGMVEVRPLKGKSTILGDMKGAFVNIVTWAADAEQYRRNVEIVIRDVGGLFVADVVYPEPVEVRRARLSAGFQPEMEDMITRAQTNPNAIIYGTFNAFENDDA